MDSHLLLLLKNCGIVNEMKMIQIRDIRFYLKGPSAVIMEISFSKPSNPYTMDL